VRVLLSAVIVMLTACATPDVAVLLPGADGKTGGVAVKQKGAEALLDSPYAFAQSRLSGHPRTGHSNASEVQRSFGAALASMPPAPVSFTVYFLSGSDEFTDESKVEVEKLLAEMARRPAPEITVIGHTDRVGTQRMNDDLSLQRAERVRELLAKSGIDAGKITVSARGEREPLIPTADDVPEPRNRRVEVNVR